MRLKTLFVALALLGCGTTEIKETIVETPVFPPVPDPIPNIPDQPGFQTLALVEDIIGLDLQAIRSQAQREETRYFNSCPLHNIGGDVEGHYQGVSLAMNRLSTKEVSLKAPVRIGKAQCIFRIRLSDYGLDRADWKLVEDTAVFDFVPETVRGDNIQNLAQTLKPWVHTETLLSMFEGDQVTNRGGQVYYSLTKQDPNLERWFLDEGVDRQQQVDDEIAVFAGFQDSGIALGKGRLVVIYESDNGYITSTHDTILGNDTLFELPFTQEIVNTAPNTTSKVFPFNAQEHIATNRNGLAGTYRLA